MSRADYDFDLLQELINGSLTERFAVLTQDAEKLSGYAAKFDRSMEEGFYSGPGRPRAWGEKPTWAPNPAYMDSLEELWGDNDALLASWGLRLSHTLRQGFHESTEYKDRRMDHRRVFTGQIVEVETERAVTFYVLTVPHSHSCFRYLVPPTVYLSKALPPESISDKAPGHVERQEA